MSKVHSPSLPAVVSIAPITLRTPGRGVDLQVRISAPVTGDALPVIIFSHGNGQSLYAYGPLVDHWAAYGFVVIQPTHLDSRMLGLAPDDPRRRQFWRYREEDIAAIVDGLDFIEGGVPIVQGRLDHSRVAVAGHSWGGQTASTLLGATHPDPDNGSLVDRKDPRIKAGVLLATPGNGGEDLSEFAASALPFMHPDFSGMTTPTLVIAGDADKGRLTTRGPDWWRDPYDLSPAPKALFTAFGGEHALGGIPGYEARETTDERPQRVAAIQRLSTAFLWSALYPGDCTWADAVSELTANAKPEGSVETK